MRAPISKLSTIVFSLFLLGCVTTPEYQDPLAGISGSTVAAQPYAQVSVGVVYTDNSQQALGYLKQSYDLAQKMFVPQAAEVEPGRVTRAINQLLTNRFGSVVKLSGMNDPRRAQVNLTAAIDLKAVAVQNSFSEDSLDMTVAFFTPDGKELARFAMSDRQQVPYPAQVMFGEATNAVMGKFQQALDTSADLQAFADARPTRMASVPTREWTASVPPPAPTPRFNRIPANFAFKTSAPHPNDIAVIIGNANYERQGRDIPNIDPAYADAAGVKKYVTTALGVLPGNVIDLHDATSANFVEVFGSANSYRGQLYDWVRPGVSNVFVYYSGHGAPGKDGEAFLVPTDANAQRVDLSGYPLSQLFQNLGKLPAKSITVVLESCFSGASQAGSVIANASPVYIKPKTPPIPENVTLIAAGKADQIASWEQDKSHGLFTKYFLKAMSGKADADKNGTVSKAEMEAYLSDTLTYYARRYYGRDQTVDIKNYRMP